MKKIFYLIALILAGFFQVPNAQSQSFITGSVTDSITGEFLESVNVRLINLPTGTTTDQSGRFRLSLAPGSYTLAVTAIGYHSEEITLTLLEDQALELGNILLSPASIGLMEISVMAKPFVLGQKK